MARDVLLEDPRRVFGETDTEDQRRDRRFRVPLGAVIGSTTEVQQEVEVELELPRAEGDMVTTPISWHPVAHERMLPSFDGELVLRSCGAGRTEMSLRGAYLVPLGPIGRFGDGVAGRRIARRSITDLLDRIARNLDEEVDRRLQSIPHRPAPYPHDMREPPR